MTTTAQTKQTPTAQRRANNTARRHAPRYHEAKPLPQIKQQEHEMNNAKRHVKITTTNGKTTTETFNDTEHWAAYIELQTYKQKITVQWYKGPKPNTQ